MVWRQKQATSAGNEIGRRGAGCAMTSPLLRDGEVQLSPKQRGSEGELTDSGSGKAVKGDLPMPRVSHSPVRAKVSMPSRVK
jgi:hypothetical protein